MQLREVNLGSKPYIYYVEIVRLFAKYKFDESVFVFFLIVSVK